MAAARAMPRELRLALCAFAAAIAVYVAIASFGFAHSAPAAPLLGSRTIGAVRLGPQPAPYGRTSLRRAQLPAAARKRVKHKKIASPQAAPARPHTGTHAPGSAPNQEQSTQPAASPSPPAPPASTSPSVTPSQPVDTAVDATTPQPPTPSTPLPTAPALPALPPVPALPPAPELPQAPTDLLP
jgi:hypothetical protein